MRALNISVKNLSLAYDIKNKYLGWASEESPMEAKESNAPWAKGLKQAQITVPKMWVTFPR